MEIEILKTKEECDHVQFLITEKSAPERVQLPEIEELETLSLGTLNVIIIKLVSILNYIYFENENLLIFLNRFPLFAFFKSLSFISEVISQ